jgi:hypothetical protein
MNKKKYKKLFGITLTIVLLLINLSFFSALNSYQIQEDQITFTLSSVKGIYHTGFILNSTGGKVQPIEFCDIDSCPGKISANLDTQNLESGTYTLSYWVYDNYERKTLDFTISNSKVAESKTSTAEENPPLKKSKTQTNSEETLPSPFQKLTIKIICWTSTLFKGDYNICILNYS